MKMGPNIWSAALDSVYGYWLAYTSKTPSTLHFVPYSYAI